MRIAMLLHKSVEFDSRVRREAAALSEAGHDVTVLHLPRRRGELDGALDGFTVRSVTPPAWVRRWLPSLVYRMVFLAAFVRGVRRLSPDVVHAHDVAMLAPGAIGAAVTGAQLVYDSHEYAAGVPYRERLWALFVTALERVVIRRCAAVITVSDGIAERLVDRYGLIERPVVLRNVPMSAKEPVAPGALRERLGIGAAPLVLHQGAVAPGRGCEQLVAAMRDLPDAHLVFLGDGWPGHQARVEALVAAGGLSDRVHFLASVPIAELAGHTADADIGVSLLEDSCENHRLALPNKVFEYVAAGVPVVVGDLPELRALVERHRIGWIADGSDATALARVLRTAIESRGERADDVERARRELTWEREKLRLTELYGRLDGGSPRPTAIVLVRNAVTHDARVQREARVLRDQGHEVLIVGVAAGTAPAGDALVGGLAVRRLKTGLRTVRRRQVERGPAPARAPTRPAEPATPRTATVASRVRRTLVTADWYRRGIAEIRRARPRLIHCNDYNTMWIGVAAKLLYGTRVVYDAHELWPDRNLRPEWRPWLLACEALFVRIADATLAASPGYADVMARRYRVARPLVIRNVPDLQPAEPTAETRRPGDPPCAIYFGAITRGRGLEQAISLVGRHPTLRLRLIGPEAWSYRSELDRFARGLGVRDRVELLPPVPPDQATLVMASADVGLALIEPTCLSYRLTLPNKLFEYVAAGLPVIASNLPVMAEFVEQTGAGLTADPEIDGSLDAALDAALDPERNAAFREAAREAARSLNWASEARVLDGAYRRLEVARS
jgi:glycosyltransferase involved in cell wall biosynthesis